MALQDLHEQYIPRENSFYREHYHQIIYGIMILLALTLMVAGILIYQLNNRPLPVFGATQPDGKSMALTPYDEPNLQAEVILRFASEAATVAYSFDFANYKDQINEARKYFTDDGWNDYLRSVDALITDLVNRQLAANGVVAGAPIISNEGDYPGKGYSWRVVIPFVVTYQSSDRADSYNYQVVLMIVKVPTSENKQGIGIDQFIMYRTGKL